MNCWHIAAPFLKQKPNVIREENLWKIYLQTRSSDLISLTALQDRCAQCRGKRHLKAFPDQIFQLFCHHPECPIEGTESF